MEATATDRFRPTRLMEAVSVFIEGNPLSTRQAIVVAVPGKAIFVRTAIELLTEERFICTHKCSSRVLRHHSMKPYREASDPAVEPEQPTVDVPASRDLLTIAQVSEYLGRPVATLYDWRYKGVGPKSAKFRGKLVYRRADLEAWVDAQFAD